MGSLGLVMAEVRQAKLNRNTMGEVDMSAGCKARQLKDSTQSRRRLASVSDFVAPVAMQMPTILTPLS